MANKQVFYSTISNNEIEELCLEFYYEFVYKSKKREIYPNPPKIVFLEDIEFFHDAVRIIDNRVCINNTYEGYHNITTSYLKKIPHKKCIIANSIPLTILLERINTNLTFGGKANLFELKVDLECLSKNQKKFWNWYQKSLKVFAMHYFYKTNTCFIIKLPDILEFQDNYTKMSYRMGDVERFFLGSIEVPKWLYVTPAEELNPQDYLLIQNADVKAEFVKKIGINKLVEFGTVIDSYENYPDNEMWAKSEYKIIDMSNLKIPKVVTNRAQILEFHNYAPYIYMKNQTTGVYHLEGIHPRCRTLYDAIKMRYNGLNIKDFEIKDIK